MAGYVRRFNTYPSIEVLNAIEAINILDLTPPSPTVGLGTGALLCVAEFEDGPFGAGGDSPFFNGGSGVSEIFSSQDMLSKFGGFGFTYGATPANNPCARRHNAEDWNGNGFLKLKFIEPQRLILSRVDTSVGEVAFAPLASISGGAGPFALSVGNTLSITTSTGGPASSTAIAAAPATRLAVGATYPTGFVGGESMSIAIDGAPAFTVVFSGADQAIGDVISRINLAAGYALASNNAGQIQLTGTIEGTAGEITIADVSGTPLADLGLTAGTTAGTGNVANLAVVTVAEIITIINNTVGLGAINAKASANVDGSIRIFHSLGGGSITVGASSMATSLGLSPIGSSVSSGVHAAGTIPAGTRVRTGGGAEWVTMQTLTIPEGTSSMPVVGPFTVKVRPALDNGLATGAAQNTVTVLVDQPTFANLSVTNTLALLGAKDEPQMDVAYEAAFDATLDLASAARDADFSISARWSAPVSAKGRSNAIDASANGHRGRKFIGRAALGSTVAQAFADIAAYRSDRFFYTFPGWQVRIPEIAARGTAGGQGFTADGVITVGADGPLAMINCRLNPEENPGQETGLIAPFFAVQKVDTVLTMSVYEAFKRSGICAPRVDRSSGSIYQSGVTSDLTPGRTTQARRKMADFIQDTSAFRLVPYSKKLATNARLDGARGVLESFLSGLLSADQPAAQRIAAFSIDAVSGNTPELNALGIYVFIIKVRTLSSLDAIVLQTEIGEGVITITDLAA